MNICGTSGVGPPRPTTPTTPAAPRPPVPLSSVGAWVHSGAAGDVYSVWRWFTEANGERTSLRWSGEQVHFLPGRLRPDRHLFHLRPSGKSSTSETLYVFLTGGKKTDSGRPEAADRVWRLWAGRGGRCEGAEHLSECYCSFGAQVKSQDATVGQRRSDLG